MTISITLEAAEKGGTVFLEAHGLAGDVAILTPGDSLTFTETDSGLTIDVNVRHHVEEGFPPTIDLVADWLRSKGLDLTREDALELLRVWNGWTPPKAD